MQVRSTVLRTIGVAVGAGALAWLAVMGSVLGGSGTERLATEAVADEGPGYAIEDFAYPNADKILAEQKIKLKKGDGHILLATCDSEPGLLEVNSRVNEKVCFRISGASGYLSLELPAVFGVRGNDYDTQVDMVVGTEEKTYKVIKNGWTPVGETADPQGRDFMLLEIRASK
ncbi:hypothetical protein OG887_43890 (plasmid) [Streptomyces sp. NBC_00053]|uniref:hypothetical protein n=1 Tax=unclassified Streptomyces TaxID=2593676 RepID=UPI000FB887BC|nr:MULTISPECIES: hypothetical protein [unclassified Streptomyces]MCX4400051.1 hypothetical protein [Streptomyces sp. NBC_01767]MCX5106868.1 hypothetical protein [Streptomyces sp. NBC_00439]MCX5505950.1 hypothetical protein [Streptomyces sp. NBC_00052]MCX5554050.1 hypothetical protein [Streptomyces sp. NBC_00051]MCX5554396.1 hypothetical protein [Streptomyces sp. NBC_00051]